MGLEEVNPFKKITSHLSCIFCNSWFQSKLPVTNDGWELCWNEKGTGCSTRPYPQDVSHTLRPGGDFGISRLWAFWDLELVHYKVPLPRMPHGMLDSPFHSGACPLLEWFWGSSDKDKCLKNLSTSILEHSGHFIMTFSFSKCFSFCAVYLTDSSSQGILSAQGLWPLAHTSLALSWLLIDTTAGAQPAARPGVRHVSPACNGAHIACVEGGHLLHWLGFGQGVSYSYLGGH